MWWCEGIADRILSMMNFRNTTVKNVKPDSSWAPDPKAFGVKTSGHVVALYVDPSKTRAFLYDTREITPPRIASMPVSIMPRRES